MEFRRVILTFESVDEILWCDHSNESSLPVLTHGAIYFSKFYKMKFGNLVDICFWLNLAIEGLMKVTFQLILGLKRKFQRFKEKSEHILVEKRSCYAP